METKEILEGIFNVGMVQLIFMLVVVRIILNNYKPPIQHSLQVLICVACGIIVSMIIEPTINSFMNGIISAGIAFYGGIYFKEIKALNDEVNDEK